MEEMVINEVMNNEVMDAVETVTDVSSNNAFTNVVVVIGLGVAALVGGLVYKNRAKIAAKKEERDVARMKKKGYICYKMVDGEIVDEDSMEVSEEE